MVIDMDYIYGKFSNKQIAVNAKLMHNDIHKLLLYKDPLIKEKFFKSDEDFKIYFNNLLCRFGGLNTLLGEPYEMVIFMSTLQAAYNELLKETFDYKIFRRLIFESHNLLKSIFEEV